jgi:hypothetical protein
MIAHHHTILTRSVKASYLPVAPFPFIKILSKSLCPSPLFAGPSLRPEAYGCLARRPRLPIEIYYDRNYGNLASYGAQRRCGVPDDRSHAGP